jgi:hypothetical protein
MQTYGIKNVDTEHNNLITKLKEWTKTTFYFNRNIVYYNSYQDKPSIPDLPEDLMFPKFKPNKEDFDTPLSHLMYTLYELGKYKQACRDNVIITKLTEENKKLLEEKENSFRKSTSKKNKKVDKKDESEQDS